MFSKMCPSRRPSGGEKVSAREAGGDTSFDGFSFSFSFAFKLSCGEHALHVRLCRVTCVMSSATLFLESFLLFSQPLLFFSFLVFFSVSAPLRTRLWLTQWRIFTLLSNETRWRNHMTFPFWLRFLLSNPRKQPCVDFSFPEMSGNVWKCLEMSSSAGCWRLADAAWQVMLTRHVNTPMFGGVLSRVVLALLLQLFGNAILLQKNAFNASEGRVHLSERTFPFRNYHAPQFSPSFAKANLSLQTQKTIYFSWKEKHWTCPFGNSHAF